MAADVNKYLDIVGLQTLWDKIVFRQGTGVNSVVQKITYTSEGDLPSENIASGDYSIATGCLTTAIGEASHAEGFFTRASEAYSHAEGQQTIASSPCSHAEGVGTEAKGPASHAEGFFTRASEAYSHAEGQQTEASGDYSHAEGKGTHVAKTYIYNEDDSIKSNEEIIAAWESTKFSVAKGLGSHIEGQDNLALGNLSHAEGGANIAIGHQSHAEGILTMAIGDCSHTEGIQTKATGDFSHTEGSVTEANGDYSHAEGQSTVTYNNYEHAEGHANKSNQATSDFSGTIHSIGIGNTVGNVLNRKNAHEVLFNGDHFIYGIGDYDGTNPETSDSLQTVINNKQDTLVSGTNIKTLNGQSILGEGNIVVEGSSTVIDVLNITYLDLCNLKGNYIPSQQYRITDYITTTSQENTQVANPYHQFDIIVTADDESTLNENARATLHEGDTYFTTAGADLNAWELKYCIDNDINRFAWADSTNGKGIIYYMKDERGNECPYDFKNIQFEHPNNTTTYPDYYYTFTDKISGVISDQSLTGNCYNNIIKEYIDSNKITLNRNIFINSYSDSPCYNNSFGYNCYNNSFGDICQSNSFGDNCHSNTFATYCINNSFGNNCYNNTLDNGCTDNSFGDGCYDNFLDYGCSHTSFGGSCYDNRVRGDSPNNSFGDGCIGNSLGYNCSSNSLGIGCSSNAFGYNCRSNSLGNRCNSNSFGDHCESNSFGNSCQYNSFRTSASVADNSNLKSYCSYNHFDDGCSYNVIWNAVTTSDNAKLQNININRGVSGTNSKYNFINIDTLGSIQKINVNQVYDIVSVGDVLNITYSNLKTLKDNGQLIPGQQYRIIDYITTTSQNNTKSAEHQFDIIVTADDNKTLNHKARAIKHDFDCLPVYDKDYIYNSFDGTVHHIELPTEYQYSYILVHYKGDSEDTDDGQESVFDKTVKISLNNTTNIRFTYYNDNNSSNTITCEIVFGYDSSTNTTVINIRNTNSMTGSYNNLLNYLNDSKTVFDIYVCKDINYNVGNETDSSEYFKNQDLNAWELWYDIENDTDKYVWISELDTSSSINFVDGSENSYQLSFYNINYYQGTKYYLWKDPSSSATTYLLWCTTTIPNKDDTTIYFSDVWVYYPNTNVYDRLPMGENYTLIGCNLVYAKGVIYRMIDERGNDCPYDFKNILNYYEDVMDYVYTFGDNDWNNFKYKDDSLNTNCYCNKMGYFIDENNRYKLPINIFENNCYNNVLGDTCYRNIFGSKCHNNKLENNSRANTFGNECANNYLNIGNYNNTFGNKCLYNNLGINNHDNELGNECSHNIFGSNCWEIKFGNTCHANKFDSCCRDISIRVGSTSSDNLRDFCYYNTFDAGVSYLILYNTTTGTDGAYRLRNYHVNSGVLGGSSGVLLSKKCSTLNATQKIEVAYANNGNLREFTIADLL